jgi:hypothetical protein
MEKVEIVRGLRGYFGKRWQAVKKNPKAFTLQVLTYLFICLWMYVISKKVFLFADFQRAMIDQPFKDNYGIILSYLVPVLQIGTGIFFLFTKTRSYGFWSTIALMCVFSMYIILVLLKTWGFVPCACTLEFKLGWIGHLWLNGILITVCTAALLLEQNIKRSIKAVTASDGITKRN